MLAARAISIGRRSDLAYPYPLLHEGHPHSLAPGAHPYLLVDVGGAQGDQGGEHAASAGRSPVARRARALVATLDDLGGDGDG